MVMIEVEVGVLMNESISRLGECVGASLLCAFSTMAFSSDTGIGRGSACVSEMFEVSLVWSTSGDPG